MTTLSIQNTDTSLQTRFNRKCYCRPSLPLLTSGAYMFYINIYSTSTSLPLASRSLSSTYGSRINLLTTPFNEPPSPFKVYSSALQWAFLCWVDLHSYFHFYSMFHSILLQISSILCSSFPSLSNQPIPPRTLNHNSQLLYMLSLSPLHSASTLLYYRNRSSCSYTRNSTCIQYSMINPYGEAF